MHMKAKAVRVVERASASQAFVFACQIGFGGVLGDDDDAILTDALQSGVPVGSEDGLWRDPWRVDEAVSGLDLGATATGGRELERGFAREAIKDELEAMFETLVVEVSSAQFCFNPGLHGCSPGGKEQAKGQQGA